MKRIVVITLMAVLPLLSACNTIHGMGQDIAAVGHGVSNATK